MIIYKITNTINNKCYIGQTSKSLEERLKHHFKPYSKSYISKAIRKYGKSNFNIEILSIAKSIEELNNLEIDFINKSNSKFPNGYNILGGGRAASEKRAEVKGRPLSEEHKKRIGEANKGKVRSEESKRKNSEWHKGVKSSKESIEKRRLSIVGKNKKGAEILHLETGEIYKSFVVAAKETGISKRTIFRHCNNIQCGNEPKFQYHKN